MPLSQSVGVDSRTTPIWVKYRFHGVPHRSSIITSVRVPVDSVYCCCCVESSLQLYSFGLMSFSGIICGEGAGCRTPIEIYDYMTHIFVCVCVCVSVSVFVRWRRAMEVLVPRNRWPTCGPGAWEERQPSSCSTSSASWNTPSNPRRITCEPHRSTQTQHTHRDDSSLFTYVTSSQICLKSWGETLWYSSGGFISSAAWQGAS